MGKTIMLSALIQTSCDVEPPATYKISDVPSKRRQLRLDSNFRVAKPGIPTTEGPKATLIVAPTSLLNQWAEELKRSSEPDTLEVHIWHGTNRLDLDAIVTHANAIPVVITSYGTLVSEYSKWTEKITSPVFEGTCVMSSVLLQYGLQSE